MIKIDFSVREALTMISNGCSLDMFERIVTTLEAALGENHRCKVTITSGMTTDNRIPCIKALRKHTGWSLKQSKEWTDALVGYYNDSGWWMPGSNRISVTLKTPEVAENLLRELKDCGCEGFLS